ncbi:MAG TPA: redoxin domain-containing protein [Deltaproteobacteria bacterium]|jgi:peroxiredoxin|nr:redoxin domain-containing protein [Deltaproteobacteria bacterium]HQJ09515.1 redoxin domain-containing protein [Deltaproteobacteria bacterium]
MAMKKISCLSLAFLFCAWFSSAGAAVPEQGYGKAITRARLQPIDDKAAAAYLGIPQKSGGVSLGDIDADIIIVEIFSMYCPYCQRHAPATNELFDAIESGNATREKIRLIGIGVGNSAHEAAFFKKKYGIRFPLFSDANSAVLNSLPGVRTPYYFAIRKKGKSLNVFLQQQGAFDDPQAFLRTVIEKSGASARGKQ